MTSAISVRECSSLDDFHRCVEIQRAVWGESDLEVEPYVTFVVAKQTGGQVIGAFQGDTMVGFCLSMAGIRGKTRYLHSHMTGVLPSHRDRGIGRLLKLFQRDEALSRDIRLVEWTFDPLETRNAHFNFNRLGALSRQFIPNFYGITTSPLHRGLATDRLLVEWHLDTKRVIAGINELTIDPADSPALIHLPAELEHWKTNDLARLADVQIRIRNEFQHWFAKGYAATAVRFTLSGADYSLAPWSDF
jgi:predicted GNAT superfamily acetyltransferase